MSHPSGFQVGFPGIPHYHVNPGGWLHTQTSGHNCLESQQRPHRRLCVTAGSGELARPSSCFQPALGGTHRSKALTGLIFNWSAVNSPSYNGEVNPELERVVSLFYLKSSGGFLLYLKHDLYSELPTNTFTHDPWYPRDTSPSTFLLPQALGPSASLPKGLQGCHFSRSPQRGLP